MCAPTGRQAVTPAGPFSKTQARLTVDAFPPSSLPPTSLLPASKNATMLRSRTQERDFLPETPANWPAHCGVGRREGNGGRHAGQRLGIRGCCSLLTLPVYGAGPVHKLAQHCKTAVLVCSHLTAAEVVALGAVRPIVSAAGRVGIEVCGCGLPPRLAGILLLLLLLLSGRLPPDGAAAVAAALGSSCSAATAAAAAACSCGAVPATPAGRHAGICPALQPSTELAIGLQAAGGAVHGAALEAPGSQERFGAAVAARCAGDL